MVERKTDQFGGIIMKLLIFLHGTTIMHRNAVGATHEERLRQVREGDKSIYNQTTYVPIGDAVQKLKKWKDQGAEIIYLSPLTKSKGVRDDERAIDKYFQDEKEMLQRYSFPKGNILHRERDEQYKDIIERIAPEVLIEDDCESIGEDEIGIMHVKSEIKKRIKSIIIKEFGGIDNLPDDLDELIKL